MLHFAQKYLNCDIRVMKHLYDTCLFLTVVAEYHKLIPKQGSENVYI